MSDAGQLAKRIVVRYRTADCLRLELPAELCGPAAAAAIEAGMAGLGGLRSAAVDRGWRRLSVRWDADACSAGDVARRLFGLLGGLPLETGPAPVGTSAVGESAGDSGGPPAGGLQPLLDRFRAMLAPAPGTPAGSLQARLQPVLASALTEKAVINFFNDIVAFYLIKVHWELITKRWLKEPLVHGNAWLTTFYLVFLLVRYRKTGK